MDIISVIIVNYNSGSLLLETVRRVLLSSVPVNAYISDNGSCDESIRLLEPLLSEHPNLHIIENHVNLGFSCANNVVLSTIDSDYYLILNPDCLIEVDTIERMIEAIKSDRKVGMAGCLIINADGSEQTGCRRSIPTPWKSLLRVLHLSKMFPNQPSFQDFDLSRSPLPDKPIYVEAISGAFMLITSSALKKVGHLDPDYFLHCEDLDWCMRFSQSGYRILFVPNVIVNHIKGSCSFNRPFFVEWHKHKGMIRFYKKFFISAYPLPILWLVIAGVWLRFGLVISFYSSKYLFRYLGLNHD